MEIMIYLLIICGWLAALWYIAKEFYAIALAKGHPQKKYFWWCFWFGFFGYAMVIALPDRANGQPVASAPMARMEPAKPMAPIAPVIPESLGTDVAGELKKYKELLDMGIITQEEFDRKKRQLMYL